VARDTTKRRSALLMAHPGHELRVYDWSRMAHPMVYVLTDGSGGGGRSRLNRSARLLSRVGAQRGTIFGKFSDREVYQAMMDGEVNGYILSTHEERLHRHRLTTCPPQRSRAGAWRQAMAAREADAFYEVAGSLLSEIGYGRHGPTSGLNGEHAAATSPPIDAPANADLTSTVRRDPGACGRNDISCCT